MKKFQVQYKLVGKDLWRKYKTRWRGRKTSEFSYRKAKNLAKKLRGHRNVSVTRVRMVKPPTSKRQREQDLITRWLSGDLDGQRALLVALAKVAKDIETTLYVAESKRSLAEQWRLYRLKQAGVITWPVAYPGTSRHTWGKAADVRLLPAKGSLNLGSIPGAREAMKKHGLCLPVPGEPWHTEFGTSWRA